MPRAEIESARTISSASRVAGELSVPGDKSIAHRALILAALAQGESWFHGLPEGEGVLATVGCLRAVGSKLHPSTSTARIRGTSRKSVTTTYGDPDRAYARSTTRVLLGLPARSS